MAHSKKYTKNTPHCESCGRERPETRDGYTICCNELVCEGSRFCDLFTDGKHDVEACCGAMAKQAFIAEIGEVPGSFWMEL